MSPTTPRPQLVFVDGTPAELAQELADYLQIGDEVSPLLAKDQHEEALAKIVRASSNLNSAPEKDFTGAYNLLIHLVLESKEPKKHLPTICQNLLKPITSSPVNGPGLALNALQAIFNLLEPTNTLRYNVFMQILKFVKGHGMFDTLKPALANLPRWFQSWDMDEEDQRKMYVEIADVAADAGEEGESYQYILKALRTIDAKDSEEVTSEEAQQLSLRALRMALLSPTQYDFQDLRVLASIQALSDSHPVYSQLLDIFAEQDLEDYNDFTEEHEGFVEKEKLDHEKLQRKMRLLTFASLAASTPSREIEYAKIAKALQIPTEEIEMWAIDVIRAGLVEGKLSQQKKVFLVHRTTYRVFGEKQWRELGTRIDTWRHSLRNVLTVVRKQQAEMVTQAQREQREAQRDHNREQQRAQ